MTDYKVPILDGTHKIPTVKLGTGVADDTKFLRGDQTWESPVESIMKLLLDEATGSLTYVGKAVPGSATSSAVWQIKRLDESGGGGVELIVTYASGTGNYDKIWDSRTGYSYS